VDALLTGGPTPVELCAADMSCDCVLTDDDVSLFVGCVLLASVRAIVFLTTRCGTAGSRGASSPQG